MHRYEYLASEYILLSGQSRIIRCIYSNNFLLEKTAEEQRSLNDKIDNFKEPTKPKTQHTKEEKRQTFENTMRLLS